MFFHFNVRRRTTLKKDMEERTIHFDFVEETYTKLNKESVVSRHKFSDIISCRTSDTDPLMLHCEFKKAGPTELTAQNVHERETIVDVMKAVVGHGIPDDYVRALLSDPAPQKKITRLSCSLGSFCTAGSSKKWKKKGSTPSATSSSSPSNCSVSASTSPSFHLAQSASS